MTAVSEQKQTLRVVELVGPAGQNESRHMVRLRTLHRSLVRDPAEPVKFFDESSLQWRATLHNWARVVDAVVVLDAPDPLLAQRIRSRPQWHEVKHEPDWYIQSWMARFRGALDWVLGAVLNDPEGLVSRFDSSYYAYDYPALVD